MTIDDRQKVCRLPSLLCKKFSPFFTMSKSGINLPHPQSANLKQTLITALISNMHSKTGAPRFLRKNGVYYPRVCSGAHPLTKKPDDSGYETGHSPQRDYPAESTNRSTGTKNESDRILL